MGCCGNARLSKELLLHVRLCCYVSGATVEQNILVLGLIELIEAQDNSVNVGEPAVQRVAALGPDAV